jgi:hypothetical protein
MMTETDTGSRDSKLHVPLPAIQQLQTDQTLLIMKCHNRSLLMSTLPTILFTRGTH